MSSYSPGYDRILVDAIFFEQDQQLRKAFRERMAKLERRQQLAQVSGIHDEAVLDRLVELEIGPEILAAMEIVPLVFVAWADGRIQTQERETIMAIAKAAGIAPEDGRYPLLEHWLKQRPGSDMLQAWKHYIQGLCQQLTSEEVDRLRHELMDRAGMVAKAAGGILGFGDKTSQAERSVLDDLEKAFARG